MSQQDPIQGIKNTGLILPDQGLASPMMHVPERKAAVAQLIGLLHEPWKNLIADIGVVHPSVLSSERELPENCDGGGEKYQRRRCTGEDSAKSVSRGVLCVGRLHDGRAHLLITLIQVSISTAWL